MIYRLYHFIVDIKLRVDATECKLYLATLSSLFSNNVTSLVPQLLLMRSHNHGTFKSLEITLLYAMKTLEIMVTRSQKNILKLLKHKRQLSNLKTQISSWSQHEIEDLWNAGLCCCSPASLFRVNHLPTVCAGSKSATVGPSDEVFRCR